MPVLWKAIETISISLGAAASRWVFLGNHIQYLSITRMDPNWIIAILTMVLALVAALQIRLVRRQDEHFKNSERAWVLTDLSWSYHRRNLQLVSGQADGVFTEHTYLDLLLTCRNEGRSPAWIELISARASIVPAVRAYVSPDEGKSVTFDIMDPIGAGKQATSALGLRATGHPGKDQVLQISVWVHYRDIFGIARQTFTEYNCDNDGRNLLRYPTSYRNT